MSAAKIESIDALRGFKAALWKFQEAASIALADADAETRRVLNWLETEADTYWRGQVRKREEVVRACKEALRQKEVFKDSAGMKQSVVDEQKRLAKAQRALEEAHEKAANVVRHRRLLQREILIYKGQTQRFSTSVQTDVPRAAEGLEKIIRLVEQYAAVGAPASNSTALNKLVTYDFARPIGEDAVPVVVSGARVSHDMIAQRTASDDARRAAAPVARAAFLAFNGSRPLVLPEGIEFDRQRPDFDARVVLADRVLGATDCFFARREPVDANDSGWYVGPTTGESAEAHVAVRVGDILELRPEMRDILALPVGWSVVVGNAYVTNVFDENSVMKYPRVEIEGTET